MLDFFLVFDPRRQSRRVRPPASHRHLPHPSVDRHHVASLPRCVRARQRSSRDTYKPAPRSRSTPHAAITGLARTSRLGAASRSLRVAATPTRASWPQLQLAARAYASAPPPPPVPETLPVKPVKAKGVIPGGRDSEASGRLMRLGRPLQSRFRRFRTGVGRTTLVVVLGAAGAFLYSASFAQLRATHASP